MNEDEEFEKLRKLLTNFPSYKDRGLPLIEEVLIPLCMKVLEPHGYKKEFTQFENGDKVWRIGKPDFDYLQVTYRGKK